MAARTMRNVPTAGLITLSQGPWLALRSLCSDGNPSRPRNPILFHCHLKMTKGFSFLEVLSGQQRQAGFLGQ